MNKKNKKEIKPEVEEMDIDEASGSDEVVYEYPLVLLRPEPGQSVDRLLFNHPKPAELRNCSAKHKQKVRHVELNYQTDYKKNVFDGQYYGESMVPPTNLGVHACSFFQNGKLFMLPIDNTYDMQRRIYSKREGDEVEKAKIDDAKLAQIQSEPAAKSVRVKYARQETEWAKKRREASANYRQQLIDQDPWIHLSVNDSEVPTIFGPQIAESECTPTTTFDETQIPIL